MEENMKFSQHFDKSKIDGFSLSEHKFFEKKDFFSKKVKEKPTPIKIVKNFSKEETKLSENFEADEKNYIDNNNDCIKNNSFKLKINKKNLLKELKHDKNKEEKDENSNCNKVKKKKKFRLVKKINNSDNSFHKRDEKDNNINNENIEKSLINYKNNDPEAILNRSELINMSEIKNNLLKFNVFNLNKFNSDYNLNNKKLQKINPNNFNNLNINRFNNNLINNSNVNSINQDTNIKNSKELLDTNVKKDFLIFKKSLTYSISDSFNEFPGNNTNNINSNNHIMNFSNNLNSVISNQDRNIFKENILSKKEINQKLDEYRDKLNLQITNLYDEERSKENARVNLYDDLNDIDDKVNYEFKISKQRNESSDKLIRLN